MHKFTVEYTFFLQFALLTEDITLNSDVLMKLIILLVPRQQSKSRFQIPTELQENHTVVNLPAKSENSPYFNIAAVLDPASKGAQKLAPVLILLRSVINCNLKLILCAIDKHSDMPVKK
jgi:UDP-glucose:glycoprotein glucosyltransferase